MDFTKCGMSYEICRKGSQVAEGIPQNIEVGSQEAKVITDNVEEILQDELGNPQEIEGILLSPKLYVYY